MSVFPILLALFGQWTLSSFNSDRNNGKNKNYYQASYHKFPSLKKEKVNENFSFSPFLQKDVIGFKEALAFKESQGKYTVVNTFGYLGKYQFGKGTLELVGIQNPCSFLENPALQERAFMANLSRNKWILRREIKRFVGKRINGIVVSESGILAAAHLSGPGAVKKYLRSYGAFAFQDGYGTTIEDYMRKFKNYDLSKVKGERRARAV